jgi:hypothetical protein
MKILQITQPIQECKVTVLDAKSVQIKKVLTLQDMMTLKNKMATLKKAIKIG